MGNGRVRRAWGMGEEKINGKWERKECGMGEE